jgi:hypothetical protein
MKAIEKTKHCPWCNTDLPLSAFAWHSKNHDNRQGVCRDCHRAYCKARWKTHGAIYLAARNGKKNPKELCRRIYRQAIESGKLLPGRCEVCGCHDKIEGHHDDYRRPLSVRWMCQKHHREFHRKSNEEKRIGYTSARV